jgi:hypothetical protein
MLYTPPEALNKDIVESSAPAIHADGNSFPFQDTGKGLLIAYFSHLFVTPASS